jgi:hypothetical protein
VCVFCGQRSRLTSEHVFPECFRKTFESITPTKTPTGEKAILSALEIRDVCARCNSGPLSRLDTYLCELDDKYFSRIVRRGDRIRFQYDFDLLLRVLLKIGYNVARARKWPLGHWQEATPFIIGTARCPVEFHIFLQLTTPTPVGKINRPVSPGTTEVPPLPMSVYLMDVSSLPGLASGSWVAVWSYRFFVLREDIHAPSDLRQTTIAECLKNTPGIRELTTHGVVTVDSSSVEAFDILETSTIFNEQLAKAMELKSATELKKLRSKKR